MLALVLSTSKASEAGDSTPFELFGSVRLYSIQKALPVTYPPQTYPRKN